jgi:transcriptional regulator with XRE-family HTH domain
MIVGMQIRAARAALRWSIEEMVEKSGVTRRTIQRIEAYDGVPPSHTLSLYNIQSALEAAGVEFVGTPKDGPGIRVRVPSSDRAQGYSELTSTPPKAFPAKGLSLSFRHDQHVVG